MKCLRKALEDEKAAAHRTRALANDVGTERNNLEAKKVTDNSDIPAEIQDRAKRQEYLQMLVRIGKEKVEKASKISKTIGAIASTILKAQPFMAIINQVPQAAPAAIPWAGACLVLEVSSDFSIAWLHVS